MKNEVSVFCNCCGRKLERTYAVLAEEVCSVKKRWGYFSKKDGEIHEFELCEACYDRLIESFVIPIKRLYQDELW